MKFIFSGVLLLLLTHFSFGQKIEGTVYGINSSGNKEVLPGVNIYFVPGNVGTVSDSQGKFSLSNPNAEPVNIVFSFIGYANDTLLVSSSDTTLEVILKESRILDEVSIEVTQSTTQISMLKPVNVEVIGQGEIKKAACCNLSESFESNASVDVVYGDAVSGARAIQMLGLSGVYTQLQIENVPMLRGLSANFGLQYIPGTWLESIQITKGVGSVVNGYESMSGQINVEFLKPENKKTERLFINVYSNHIGRNELNFHFNHKVNEKVSTLLFAHGSGYFLENDINKDGFRDNPLSKQINILNRWKIQGKKTEQIFMIHGVSENKIGGQIGFDPTSDKFTFNKYGVGINTRLIEGMFKNGFLFPSSSTRSMGLIVNGRHHEQDSYFGFRSYDGIQNSMYGNLIFQDVIGNTMHNYKVGASYLLDHYNERYRDSVFSSLESVPGLFGEYTYTYPETFNLLLGIRSDFHSIYGPKFTPRVHLRYSPYEWITFRASGGTGFRTPHIFIENMSTLASQRNVIISGPLLPEESRNAGASVTLKTTLFKRDLSVNVDFYYTYFKNQIITDLDEDPHAVHFYNLIGQSFSKSSQLDVDYSPFKGLTLKLAYKHYDIKATYHDTLMEKPMVPRDRYMANVSYQTPSKKWRFDLISNYFSSSRLPNTMGLPDDIRFKQRSEPYYIIHFQITKLFRKFEWYLGGENLLNFTQKQAIMSPDDPFGSHFDASMIWGPLNGRIFYTGIRINIKHK